LKLEQKQQIVTELTEKFANSKVVIATDYKGLDVASMTALRKKLFESDVHYKVVKNTLLKKASEGNEVSLIKDLFKGPTGVAFSMNDPVSPAKLLVEFAKANEKLEIKGGVLGGKKIDFEGIKALSELPSKEVLLGQLLSVFSAVPTRFVRVLNGVPQNFMNVLSAVKEKKEAETAV